MKTKELTLLDAIKARKLGIRVFKAPKAGGKNAKFNLIPDDVDHWSGVLFVFRIADAWDREALGLAG